MKRNIKLNILALDTIDEIKKSNNKNLYVKALRETIIRSNYNESSTYCNHDIGDNFLNDMIGSLSDFYVIADLINKKFSAHVLFTDSMITKMIISAIESSKMMCHFICNNQSPVHVDPIFKVYTNMTDCDCVIIIDFVDSVKETISNIQAMGKKIKFDFITDIYEYTLNNPYWYTNYLTEDLYEPIGDVVVPIIRTQYNIVVDYAEVISELKKIENIILTIKGSHKDIETWNIIMGSSKLPFNLRVIEEGEYEIYAIGFLQP